MTFRLRSRISISSMCETSVQRMRRPSASRTKTSDQSPVQVTGAGPTCSFSSLHVAHAEHRHCLGELRRDALFVVLVHRRRIAAYPHLHHNSERRFQLIGLPTRPRLVAQDGIVGEPTHDHRILRHYRHLLSHARLLFPTILHHGRAGAQSARLKTHPRAGGQEDRRGCEGAVRPRPAYGVGWHLCAPVFRAARLRDLRARLRGEG